VLTPQAAERLARLNRSNAQTLMRSELETPGWSSAVTGAALDHNDCLRSDGIRLRANAARKT